MEPLLLASLEGGAVILVVWGLTRAFPGLPVAARCALWWLASLRLLVGLVGAPIGVPLLPAPEVAALPDLPLAAEAAPAPVLPTEAGVDASSILLGLWITIAGLLLAHTARQAWRAARIRREAVPADGNIAALCATLAGELALGRVPEVRLSAEIDGAMVIGLWRPTILLGERAATLGDDELRLALAHELAHVRRRDLLWGWIPILAARVFFFHPLAHVALREYLLAREAACDAAVLALPGVCPQRYGALLVRQGARRRLAGAAGMVSSVPQLKRRLTMMQNVSKLRYGRASALLVVGLAALVPLTVSAREGDKAPARCTVVVDDAEGRRTIPCDEMGVTPPPRRTAPVATGKKAPPAPAVEAEMADCFAAYRSIMSCVSSSDLVPEEAKAQVARSMDSGLAGLRQAFRIPAGRRAVAEACRSLLDAKQQVFESLGCTE
jgi:beta-lactamase regulating signal transducer with metallopeptidase domain